MYMKPVCSWTSYVLIKFIAKACPEPSLTLLWHSEFLAHCTFHSSPCRITNIPVNLNIYSNFLKCCSVQFMSLSMIYHTDLCLSHFCNMLFSQRAARRTCFSSSLGWKDKKEWFVRGWGGCLGGIFSTLPYFVFINNSFP